MFAHINLIAKDWKKLAYFYETVFGCIPVPPIRDLSGEWLDRATGIKNAHIRGIHLRLPFAVDDDFQYVRDPESKNKAIRKS